MSKYHPDKIILFGSAAQDKADDDFNFATANLREGSEFFSQICFHFQQTAEKYLKAGHENPGRGILQRTTRIGRSFKEQGLLNWAEPNLKSSFFCLDNRQYLNPLLSIDEVKK